MPRRLAILALACSVSLVLAWAIGCLVNDRWAWSQWLWWIPAPVALVASLSWLACTVALPRGAARRRLVVAGGAALVVAAGASMQSFRLVDRASSASALHLLCWNAGWPGEQAPTCARALAPWSGRVMIISNPGRLAEHASQWMRPGDAIAEAGTFLLTGPVTVIEARPIVQGDDGFATLFRFEDAGSGETSVLAVDLPSSPARARYEAMARFSAQVRASVDLRSVDMIVGDFNCTRGSASLHAAFPGFDDAWSASGQGWGASWPRQWPILHIDLALVSGRMRAERCELHDPGIGHHRLNALTCSRGAR